MNNTEAEKQRKGVMRVYDKMAPTYDKLNNDAQYQGEAILLEMYKKYGISAGKIFDIGCGTGKVKDLLGDSFTYEGVDLSPAMTHEAAKRGYTCHTGAVEDVIKEIGDKSVDHVIALSCLYFIEDVETLIKECERISRKSIFIILEHFGQEAKERMESAQVHVYNHPLSIVKDPTETKKDIFLWKRPSTGDIVNGNALFKLLE